MHMFVATLLAATFAQTAQPVIQPAAAPATSAPAAAPEPDAQAQATRDAARKVIDKASGWTQGAIDWLSTKGGNLKVSATGWRESAETRLKAAIDDALSVPAAPLGVRLLALTDTPGTPALPRWVALDDTPVKLSGRVVLLVHGLDEPGNVWDDLAPMLREQGYAVARFDYADDQPIALSADNLAAALASLRKHGVTEADLVCHSKGGLVARDTLTRATYYGSSAARAAYPTVSHWILLGAPNQGSSLARVRYICEAREHLCRWFESDGKDPRLLLGFLKDGSGEAGTDLLPASAFLTDLNARPLPAGVKITNIIGTLAEPERATLEEVVHSEWIRKVVSEQEIARMCAALQSCADVIGDGIVTVESARLKGVEDEVLVAANHRSLVKRPTVETALRENLGEPRKIPSGVPVILDRLKR